MSSAADQEPRDDSTNPDRAERFRATARHIAAQLDHAEVAASIEAAMWQFLDAPDGSPECPESFGCRSGVIRPAFGRRSGGPNRRKSLNNGD